MNRQPPRWQFQTISLNSRNLSGLRHKYDDVRCTQFGLWRGAKRAHPRPGAVTDEQRSHRPNSAQPGGRQVFFAQTLLLAPHRSTAGYARRSRLVWAKNPLPRTTSYLCFRPLSRRGAGNPPVADQGQIQLDCFGRINGAGWHWAGEADVFESIAAVKKRFNIDDNRVMIRGFSQGGEGAWHISLHHPYRFAAAEIGAGTVSRTAQRPGLTPYQLATLRIWENISEWALNIHNLPLAGHDGENDPGQLESSLRARAQLEKEGFPSVGDPDYLRSQGAPGLWMQSLATGHGTSPLVRQRL